MFLLMKKWRVDALISKFEKKLEKKGRCIKLPIGEDVKATILLDVQPTREGKDLLYLYPYSCKVVKVINNNKRLEYKFKSFREMKKALFEVADVFYDSPLNFFS